MPDQYTVYPNTPERPGTWDDGYCIELPDPQPGKHYAGEWDEMGDGCWSYHHPEGKFINWYPTYALAQSHADELNVFLWQRRRAIREQPIEAILKIYWGELFRKKSAK